MLRSPSLTMDSCPYHLTSATFTYYRYITVRERQSTFPLCRLAQPTQCHSLTSINSHVSSKQHTLIIHYHPVYTLPELKVDSTVFVTVDMLRKSHILTLECHQLFRLLGNCFPTGMFSVCPPATTINIPDRV